MALPATRCEQPSDVNGGNGRCTSPALVRFTYTTGKQESVCYLHMVGIKKFASDMIQSEQGHVIGARV